MDKFKQLISFRREIKEKEDDLEILKKRVSEIEQEVISDMASDGMTSIKIDGVTIYSRIDTYYRIDPEKQSQAHEWLAKIGLGELIKQTVNANSLRSAMKELEGIELDQSIIKTEIPKVGIRGL